MSVNLEVLRGMETFTGLKDHELESMAAIAEPVGFKKGATVFEQGDPSDAMYLIVTGKVKVIKGGGGKKHLRNVAELGPGDVLGEMGILLDEPRTATATATSACELLRIRRAAFHKLRTKHDPGACKVAFNLGRLVAMRLRDLNNALVGIVEQGDPKGNLPAAELKQLRERFFKQGFTI